MKFVDIFSLIVNVLSAIVEVLARDSEKSE